MSQALNARYRANRFHPLVVVCTSIAVLFLLLTLLQTATFNKILNPVVNPQVAKPEPVKKVSKDKIIINHFLSARVNSRVFVLVFCFLAMLLFDAFTGAIVIFYFSIVFVFKQFYYSTKTFTGFSNFLVSFVSTSKTKHKSLILKNLTLFDDQSINFELLKLTLLPVCYLVIMRRVRHIDYVEPLEWLSGVLGQDTSFWLVFVGLALSWLLNTLYLMYSSGGFSWLNDLNSSDNLNQTIDLDHQSHPTNLMSNFYETTSRVVHSCMFLGTLLGVYCLNRDFPRDTLLVMMGVCLYVFHKIIRYKFDFNHTMLYRNVKTHLKFPGSKSVGLI